MKLQNDMFTIDIVTVNTDDVRFEDYDVVHFKENVYELDFYGNPIGST